MTPQRTHLAAQCSGLSSYSPKSMLGYIHACFSRRAAQEVRNEARLATSRQPPVPRRAMSVFIPKITLSALSITSISDKKVAATPGGRPRSSLSEFHNKKCLTTVARGFYKERV